MRRAMLIVTGLALAATAVSGQTSPGTVSFEVASVNPAAAKGPDRMMVPPGAAMEEQIRFRGGPGSKDPGRIDYSGVTLKMLLKRAYDLDANQIAGPDWLDSERYDVAAKVPPGTNAEDFRLMLQGLLAERFQISLHREVKTLPVYFLTVAKNGPKLGPAEKLPEDKDDEERKAAAQKKAMANLDAMLARQRNGEIGPSRWFHLDSATTAKFARTLSSYVDRPVRDKTQLEGLYAFSLSWVPDDARTSGGGRSGPSCFAAVEEQLGLKLQRGNEQTDVLVIDKAEKTPTSN